MSGNSETMVIFSSLHGRERRLLRDITKRNLEAAVKYGKKERGHNCPKTGLPRWKYTYADIVYITDYTSTVEVTSYVLPIEIKRAPISPSDEERYNEAIRLVEEDPMRCTSHTVIIIDQSASMKTCDVTDFRSRSDAA